MLIIRLPTNLSLTYFLLKSTIVDPTGIEPVRRWLATLSSNLPGPHALSLTLNSDKEMTFEGVAVWSLSEPGFSGLKD